jgi:hypothetical protein
MTQDQTADVPLAEAERDLVRRLQEDVSALLALLAQRERENAPVEPAAPDRPTGAGTATCRAGTVYPGCI